MGKMAISRHGPASHGLAAAGDCQVATGVASIGAWRQTPFPGRSAVPRSNRGAPGCVASRNWIGMPGSSKMRGLYGGSIRPPFAMSGGPMWRIWLCPTVFRGCTRWDLLSGSLPRLPGFLEQVRRDTSHDKVSVDFQVHPQTSENEHLRCGVRRSLWTPTGRIWVTTSAPNPTGAKRPRRHGIVTRPRLPTRSALVQAPPAAGVLLLLPVYRPASRPRMSLCGALVCWAGLCSLRRRRPMGAGAPSGQ